MKLLHIIAILVVAISAIVFAENNIDKFNKTLIYENNFNSFEDLDDWVLEGPGKSFLANNKMMLIPHAQQAVYRKWEQAGRRVLKANEEYYATVEQTLQQYYPDTVEKVKLPNGKIGGGHIVTWNKAFETSANYIVEYDFKPYSPIGLGIIFFSATGIKGEDVLSDTLKPRYGIFNQYIKSDLNSYHISYWANNAAVGKRNTCNLRKNTGAFCLANGIDPTGRDFSYEDKEFDFKTYKIRLVKIKNNVKFYINDELSINWTDNRYNNIVADEGLDVVVKENVDTGEVLGGGRIGLRQMVGLIGAYDNFKVYSLKAKK